MTSRRVAGGMLVALMACLAPARVSANPPKTFRSVIGLELVPIPAGTFEMGGDPNFEDASKDEVPRHRVTIRRPFYLAKTEVTQEQWVAVMGSNPSETRAAQSR